MIEQMVNFVRDYFLTDDFIPLHEPISVEKKGEM